MSDGSVKLPGEAPFAEEGEGRAARDPGRRLQIARSRPSSWIRRRLCRRARRRAALAGRSLPFGRPVDIDLKHWWEFGVSVLIVQPSVLRIRPGDGVASAMNPLAGAPSPPVVWADGSAWFATCVINADISFNGFARDPGCGRSSADSKSDDDRAVAEPHGGGRRRRDETSPARRSSTRGDVKFRARA